MDDRTRTEFFERHTATTRFLGRGRTSSLADFRTATSGDLPFGGRNSNDGGAARGLKASSVNLEVHGGSRADRRRFSRYDSRLKVRLVTRERETIYFTRSVSSTGMFIYTENPARSNQLLRLRVAIPEVEGELKMLALVRWRRSKQEAHASGLQAGMGVTFYQVPDNAKLLWAELIRTFEDRLQFAPFEEAEIKTETGPIKVAHQRRRQSRLRRSMTVSWTVKGRIYQNITDDVSPGGFFIPKVQTLMPGTRLEFTLFSTANLDAFRVEAEILRVESGQQGRHGCAVRIRRLLDGDEQAFQRFVTPDAPDLGVSDDLVIEDHGPFHVPGPADRLPPEVVARPSAERKEERIKTPPLPLEGRRPSEVGAVFEGFEPRTHTTREESPSPSGESDAPSDPPNDERDSLAMDLEEFIRAGMG